MINSKNKTLKMVLSAMFLALAMVLPFLTGQIPEIGNMLCPMHIPVLLCGFICGPIYGFVIGLIAPLLRFSLFGMPPIIPQGISMCVELAVYGLVSGLLYNKMNKKKWYIYLVLIIAMILGRIAWGITRVLIFELGGAKFSWALFIAGAFTNAIPGIILQLVIIPPLVMIISSKYNKKTND